MQTILTYASSSMRVLIVASASQCKPHFFTTGIVLALQVAITQSYHSDSHFLAMQVFDTAEPFVTPSVPPIRTKGPSPSPSSTPAVRSSSRFTERFTSPTTTRIVDELLDEVVAHRLTPRDSASALLT